MLCPEMLEGEAEEIEAVEVGAEAEVVLVGAAVVEEEVAAVAGEGVIGHRCHQNSAGAMRMVSVYCVGPTITGRRNVPLNASRKTARARCSPSAET